ncbi:Basic proline-rich protein [Frankia sp. AiPs1]|uniref:PH-like domain-containing protein n=1 Tax=Frankia sp. AiPa1 TaxID=573492 RepID=UPI00202B4851|nr:hypothetical protein [Frankia sp. AiPa1]MCL9760280.1 hypothetical protein [Frankia sp. AiPa1]
MSAVLSAGPAVLSAGPVLVAAGSTQTRLALRVLLVVGLLLVVIAALGALVRAWRNRAQRREEDGLPDVPDLPEAPAEPGTVLAAPLRGTYLGTADAGHWREWIATRGLGGRLGGYLSVYETGVRVDQGGTAFWIPREAVRGARLERAHAGKVSTPGRLIVVAWSYGGRELETGFRGEDRARQPKVVRAVHELIGPPPPHLASGDVTSPHALPWVRPRLRPRSIGHGGPPRPGSGQPTEEMPAIRAGLRRRRGSARSDGRQGDPRAAAARYPGRRPEAAEPPRRRQPGYPDPGRSASPGTESRGFPTAAAADSADSADWYADPRPAQSRRPGHSHQTQTGGSPHAAAPRPGGRVPPEPTDSGRFPVVDPLTSPLGEVRRLKEDR